MAIVPGPAVLGIASGTKGESSLRIGTREQDIFYGAFGREPIDDDGSGLSNSVSTILGLEILLWVPIGVKQDNGIGCS
jgi:hypothetical protein